MSKTDSQQLARTWIECWAEGRPEDIPLAEGFVHVSPFGRLEGRSHYLEVVKPMAEQSVTSLRILRTLGQPGEAVVLYDMDTAGRTIPACDWVFVRDGKIVEIRSFYDASKLRE